MPATEPPPTTRPTTQAPTSPLEPVDSLPYFMGGDGTQELPCMTKRQVADAILDQVCGLLEDV